MAEKRPPAPRIVLHARHVAPSPFSSGRYGDAEDTGRVRPLWQILNEEGADVLLTGHEHSYERFAPMDADGERDDARGVRLFVVGTGSNLRQFANDPLATTEARSHLWRC